MPGSNITDEGPSPGLPTPRSLFGKEGRFSVPACVQRGTARSGGRAWPQATAGGGAKRARPARARCDPGGWRDLELASTPDLPRASRRVRDPQGRFAPLRGGPRPALTVAALGAGEIAGRDEETASRTQQRNELVSPSRRRAPEDVRMPQPVFDRGRSNRAGCALASRAGVPVEHLELRAIVGAAVAENAIADLGVDGRFRPLDAGFGAGLDPLP